MNKSVLYLGTVVYLILGILAYIFFLERTVFLDISFHLFYILKDGTFAIQNNRFGAMATQFIPLIGAKFGLSLVTIMKLYSVGFVMFYYAIFFICVKLLKSYKFGLAMLLLSTLMVTDTFYWIQSELPQGLAILILYFCLLTYLPKRNNWIAILALFFLNITLAFFHPLLIFPFVFCTLFLYLNISECRPKLKISLLVFFSVLVVKSVFFRTEYDTGSMGGLKNFLTLFPDYVTLESNKQFLLALVKDYYLMLALFVGLLVYYIKNKRITKALLIGTFFLAYSLLINVSYPNGADQFYIENLYLPLSIFVIIPFVLDINLTKKQVNFSLLSILIALRLMHIGFNHQFYSDRLSYLQNFLNETAIHSQEKMILHENHMNVDTMLMTWATPYEFWLLSTTQSNETRSIVVTDDVSALEWTKNAKSKFITKWGVFDYTDLPTNYFILKDTSLYQYRY